MRTPFYRSVSLATLLLLAGTAVSFAADKKAAETPLEITANTALEWNQNAKTYTARGNALAKQNDLSVHADTLVATYDDTTGSANNITKLTADGHVTLTSGTDKATADKAVYDLVKGQGDLTGARPKITRANGDSLEADHITIWTVKADTGAGTLDHAEATGKVIITNGTQQATSDKATFTANSNLAELFGNVRISQEKSWLTGDYADLNMATHISHVKTNGTSKQVKGIFYTKSSALPTTAKPTTEGAPAK